MSAQLGFLFAPEPEPDDRPEFTTPIVDLLDQGNAPCLYCGENEHDRCPKRRLPNYPCTCTCAGAEKPACYACGTPTNLVLITYRESGVDRRPCCFNVDRGCDAAAKETT